MTVVLAGVLLDGVERGLAPVDGLRRALYRALVPVLGPWIRSREVRIGLHGAVAVVGSFALAVVAPLWLLALGPLLLGVPHLVADLRYLVARPGLHRRAGAPLVGALLVGASLAGDVRIGLAGALLAPLLSRAPVGRRLLVAAPLAALLLASLLAHVGTVVGLAHAHNAIAVLAWLVLATALGHGGAGHPARLATSVAFVGFGAALLAGLADPWWSNDLGALGAPSLRDHLGSLAPDVPAPWGRRLVATFAYAQSVHYGVWLRVVPEDGRDRPSPRSWQASVRALRRDLGEPALALAVVGCVVLAVWGAVALAAAREGYLRLALFHGPMELAVLAVVAAEGRRALRP